MGKLKGPRDGEVIAVFSRESPTWQEPERNRTVTLGISMGNTASTKLNLQRAIALLKASGVKKLRILMGCALSAINNDEFNPDNPITRESGEKKGDDWLKEEQYALACFLKDPLPAPAISEIQSDDSRSTLSTCSDAPIVKKLSTASVVSAAPTAYDEPDLNTELKDFFLHVLPPDFEKEHQHKRCFTFTHYGRTLEIVCWMDVLEDPLYQSIQQVVNDYLNEPNNQPAFEKAKEIYVAKHFPKSTQETGLSRSDRYLREDFAGIISDAMRYTQKTGCPYVFIYPEYIFPLLSVLAEKVLSVKEMSPASFQCHTFMFRKVSPGLVDDPDFGHPLTGEQAATMQKKWLDSAPEREMRQLEEIRKQEEAKQEEARKKEAKREEAKREEEKRTRACDIMARRRTLGTLAALTKTFNTRYQGFQRMLLEIDIKLENAQMDFTLATERGDTDNVKAKQAALDKLRKERLDIQGRVDHFTEDLQHIGRPRASTFPPYPHTESLTKLGAFKGQTQPQSPCCPPFSPETSSPSTRR